MNCSVCGHVLSGERCEGCGARRGRHRIPLSGLSGPKYSSSWKVIAISLGAAVLVTAIICWLASASAEKRYGRMKDAQGNFDEEVLLPPGKDISYVITVLFSSHYSFTVSPIDGRVDMACGQIDDGDQQQMNPKDIGRALERAVSVEAGKSNTLSGLMERGRYVWAVSNPTGQKVRVKITFQ